MMKSAPRLGLFAAVLAVMAVAALWPSSAQQRRAFATGETCSPARPHASGTTQESLVSGSLTRTYRLHVPPSYTGATPVPVVFSFHGLGSNSLEQEVYSGLAGKSDSIGFIAVFPQGSTSGFPSNHWNAWQLPPAHPDDVAFTSAIIDVLASTLCIDQTRVYTSGISNGAMMSVRLACSLSKRFAAFAPVAGAYFPPMSLNTNPNETCPDAAVRPMIAFHGTADTSVPFNGGGAANYRLPQDNNTPDPDVLSSWAAYDACGGARQETQIDTEIRLVQYDACPNGAVVQLYIVDGGGHTWPGSFDVPSLGYTTHQISATDLMWTFFTAYTLPDADTDLMPDAADNCPDDANFDQADADADALGDVCETPAGYGTDPAIRDTDGDGCADGREVRTLQFAPAAGGSRNPLLASDFYDVNGTAKVDAVDIALVRAHFNPFGPVPPEDAIYDRSVGAAPWAPGPADNKINAVDIALVRNEFNHNCTAPP